jgi:hypothetical protein
MQMFSCLGQQYSYRFFWWRARQCLRYGIPPELHAHHANGGGACGVCHAGDIDVEGSYGEIGIA